MSKVKKIFKETMMKQKMPNKWYSIRSLLGNTEAVFHVLIGGREVDKSELDLNTIYREKQKEYFELFPEMSSSDRKGVSNARKYAKECISKNIFGSP